MKYFIFLFLFFFSWIEVSAQTQKKTIRHQSKTKSIVSFNPEDYKKEKDSLPDLILKRIDGKLGFVNQKGKIIIQPEYDFGNFFFEDCNLLQSPNPKLRKFGTDQYASVTVNQKDYRIDKRGKKVYQFKQEDLGPCASTYQEPFYFAYNYGGYWGIVHDKNFSTPYDYKGFTIYPQYEYLYVLTSKDQKNPMIIAVKNGKYGVIDIHNTIIIPFEYAHIKKNFSWRIANLFEVSLDNLHYFFVDTEDKSY